MNIGEIIMRVSAIKLLANMGDKQAVLNECDLIIAACESTCQDCNGTGWFGASFCDGEECSTCDGTGDVKKAKGVE